VLSRLSAEKRVFRAKIAFIRRKSRFSREKRVHPACDRVYPPKITFFKRKSCFSREKRVHPACCRVYPSKIEFIGRKTGQEAVAGATAVQSASREMDPPYFS